MLLRIVTYYCLLVFFYISYCWDSMKTFCIQICIPIAFYLFCFLSVLLLAAICCYIHMLFIFYFLYNFYSWKGEGVKAGRNINEFFFFFTFFFSFLRKHASRVMWHLTKWLIQTWKIHWLKTLSSVNLPYYANCHTNCSFEIPHYIHVKSYFCVFSLRFGDKWK